MLRDVCARSDLQKLVDGQSAYVCGRSVDLDSLTVGRNGGHESKCCSGCSGGELLDVDWGRWVDVRPIERKVHRDEHGLGSERQGDLTIFRFAAVADAYPIVEGQVRAVQHNKQGRVHRGARVLAGRTKEAGASE